MKTKVDLEILDEQIQYLDGLTSIITNEYTRRLVDGIVNLLSAVSFAVEEEAEIKFVSVN